MSGGGEEGGEGREGEKHQAPNLPPNTKAYTHACRHFHNRADTYFITVTARRGRRSWATTSSITQKTEIRKEPSYRKCTFFGGKPGQHECAWRNYPSAFAFAHGLYEWCIHAHVCCGQSFVSCVSHVWKPK
jgi:hypothetical protein